MSVVVIVVKNDNHIVPFWVTQCASMSPGKFIPDGIIPYKLCEISSIAVSLFGTQRLFSYSSLNLEIVSSPSYPIHFLPRLFTAWTRIPEGYPGGSLSGTSLIPSTVMLPEDVWMVFRRDFCQAQKVPFM